MREKMKKYYGLLFVLLMAVVVIAVLGWNNDLGEILRTLGSLKLTWVVMAGGCIALYLFLRMATLRFYLSRRGYRIAWIQAAAVTGAGQFYSAITPSASGGQPMQVLYLHRMGVPVSLGTACVCVKFLGFQMAFLAMGAVLWAVSSGMVAQQLAGFRWLVAAGFLINSGLIAAVLLTIPKTRVVDRLIRFLIRLGERIRIVKDGDALFESFESAIRDYRDALLQLLRRPMDAIVVFVLSMLQVLAFMAVVICLYHAFGLAGEGAVKLLTLQLLLFIAAAFVPLPGAAGAQESGFCIFFNGIFPGETLMAAMVSWRFFSYYLLLFMGLVMMLPEKMFRKRVKK